MISFDAIQAVLFDKDGTLIDYHKSWEPTNRRAAALASGGDAELALRLLERGGTDPRSGITRAGSLLAAGNTREIAQSWIEAGSPYDLASLITELDALFTEAAGAAVPVTDLARLFEGLAERGIAIGIASSDSETAIRRLLRLFEADRYVRFVAGYDSGHGVKPGPGMLLGFSEAVEVPPERIAVVGDNLHDLEMARSGGAGLRIGVLTGTGDEATLATLAHLCLPSIADVAERFSRRPDASDLRTVK